MFCCKGNMTKEPGRVSVTFTIPMYNVSRLQVNEFYQFLYITPDCRSLCERECYLPGFILPIPSKAKYFGCVNGINTAQPGESGMPILTVIIFQARKFPILCVSVCLKRPSALHISVMLVKYLQIANIIGMRNWDISDHHNRCVFSFIYFLN